MKSILEDLAGESKPFAIKIIRFVKKEKIYKETELANNTIFGISMILYCINVHKLKIELGDKTLVLIDDKGKVLKQFKSPLNNLDAFYNLVYELAKYIDLNYESPF